MNLPTNRQIHILWIGSYFQMAEFRSKVNEARPKSNSLRTTIPEAVVQLMELAKGDEIVWIVKPGKDALEIVVSKA